ncbi:methyltransferase family protein [Kineococcus xinjiangensis]|uniref:Methyltransferase family protein n=1 Tax=Kineococcus xinjiangensis TaxID=512762 RepID=A0A2S6IGV4_9ACTN|nr:methyltransferase domain-containing protein [Kineococcus xinjiangensis]PPK93443.1 methyltransferase family protein [Kineococcus xinjiangensis]
MGRFENVTRLAQPASRSVVADLGCGPGRLTRALLATDAALVHAVDVAATLDDDLLLDPRVRAHIADLDRPLPLPEAGLDVAISLNTLEHLADPAAHLDDVQRLLRPGGRFVLAQSDWDTALFSSTDDQLTRTLIDHWVAHAPSAGASVDGFAGRKLLRYADVSGLALESVHSWADPHRRFDVGSVAWKVATGVLAAVSDDRDLSARAAGWVEELRQLARAGRFLFTVTDVAVVLRKA